MSSKKLSLVIVCVFPGCDLDLIAFRATLLHLSGQNMILYSCGAFLFDGQSLDRFTMCEIAWDEINLKENVILSTEHCVIDIGDTFLTHCSMQVCKVHMRSLDLPGTWYSVFVKYLVAWQQDCTRFSTRYTVNSLSTLRWIYCGSQRGTPSDSTPVLKKSHNILGPKYSVPGTLYLVPVPVLVIGDFSLYRVKCWMDVVQYLSSS